MPHVFFLNTRIDYEFLTNDGREYHKFVSAMWCWIFLYEVVHVVHMYINHLHFADYDHVHQHFAENSFWIYQECCQMDIQAWKSQWYIILIHFTNIQNFVYKISCLREGSKWGGGGGGQVIIQTSFFYIRDILSRQEGSFLVGGFGRQIYDETGAAACNIHCYTVIGFW